MRLLLSLQSHSIVIPTSATPSHVRIYNFHIWMRNGGGYQSIVTNAKGKLSVEETIWVMSRSMFHAMIYASRSEG